MKRKSLQLKLYLWLGFRYRKWAVVCDLNDVLVIRSDGPANFAHGCSESRDHDLVVVGEGVEGPERPVDTKVGMLPVVLESLDHPAEVRLQSNGTLI